ncbi:MAG: hypothetical protein IT289_00640 [Oligoflexia bacterium]|nr:hypothetical protein [Oligoflexia bacterium]
MSSEKKGDLATELVQFLLKEEAQKKKSEAESPQENKGPKPQSAKVPDQPAAAPATAEFSLDVDDPNLQALPKPQGQKEPEIPVRPVPGKTDFNFGPTQMAAATAMTEKATQAAREVGNIVGGVEALRTAQNRITQLERERDELRDETERLLSHAESLQRRVGELKTEVESSERKYREKVEILEEEKIVVKGRLSAREMEVQDLKQKYDEIQIRFQNDLRKIRVRERELENRLALMRSEMTVVMGSKDDIILELRRQLEQLSFELDNFKAKSADLSSKLSEFHDRNHRTVKALRLALSMLEAGEVEDKKKAAG